MATGGVRKLARDGSQWRLHVRIREVHAVPRDAVHRGRVRLRMALQRPDPVVEVVEDDEEDVGTAGGLGLCAGPRPMSPRLTP